MLRLFLRILAALSLAVAVVLAVIDATRSIATDRLSLASLAESWEAVAPDALEASQGVIASTPFQSTLRFLLEAPAAAVFFGLFLALYLLGHARAGRGRPFASA